VVTGHVFIATTLDGFIARPDGDVQWLLERDDPGEDHGYQEFIAGIDLILMGRKSYEKALEFGPWPYDRPVLVLSTQLAGTPVPSALTGKVSFTCQRPAQLMVDLATQGVRHVYLDGGQVIQSFLREGLIADLVITIVPVLLGEGIRLFGETEADIDLELVNSRSFPSGLVQARYRVAR